MISMTKHKQIESMIYGADHDGFHDFLGDQFKKRMNGKLLHEIELDIAVNNFSKIQSILEQQLKKAENV